MERTEWWSSVAMAPPVTTFTLGFLTYAGLLVSICVSAPPPAFLQDGPASLEKMTLDITSGDIIVGATNIIYRLSPDLEKLDQVSIGPVLDHPMCWVERDCKFERTSKQVYIKVLLLNNQDQSVLVCGTAFQGSCLRLSSRNLTNVNWIYQPIVRSNPDPQFRPTVALLDRNNRLFIGTSVNTDSQDYKNSQRIPLLSTRDYLSPSLALVGNATSFTLDRGGTQPFLQPSVALQSIYRYGFEHNGHFYSISNQLSQSHATKYTSYIGRVCKSDTTYRSYVEAQLYCDSKGDQYNFLTAAHFGPVGRSLAQVLGLNENEHLLYAVFTKDVYKSADSAICLFRITDIDDILIKAIRRCFGGIGSIGPNHLVDPAHCTAYNMKIPEDYCGENDFNFPIRANEGVSPTVRGPVENASATALISTTIGTFTLLYIGTKNGQLLKASVESHSNVLIYDKLDVQLGSPVSPDILISTDGGRIYAMTRKKLVTYAVSCEQHTTCGECMAHADPICGWCFWNQRCMADSLCKGEPESWGWAQTRVGKCPAIEKTRPVQIPTGSNVELELWLTELPEFPADIQCVIGSGDLEQRVAANLIPSTYRFSCTGGRIWPPLDAEQHSLIVPVHLEINRVKWLSTTVVLFDCQRHSSCVACTTSVETCAWCVNTQRCTDATTVSRLEKCGNERFIYSNNATASVEFPSQGPGFCPRIEVIPSREPLLHSDVSGNIELAVHNIPQEVLTTTVRCEIGSEQFPAVFAVDGDQNVIRCSNVKLDYSGDQPFHYEPIRVTMGDKEAYIDNPDNTTLTLYNCLHMAVSCGQCLTLDPKYNCGFCEVYCYRRELCPTDWRDKNDVCPNPQITRVQPSAGPLGGGTVLTIHGVDLGQERAQIQDGVTVAHVPCRVTSYSPPTIIECVTAAVNTSTYGNVRVTVSSNGSQTHTASSGNFYTYVDPTIQSIRPAMGPRSGGTTVTLSGLNLDVGSQVEVHIGTKEAGPRRRKRAVSASQTSAPILRRDSEKIIFKTPDAEAEGNETFLITIDGNSFQNDSVVYGYVKDPTVTNVTGLNVLPSGGSEIKVLGERFELIQNPALIVYTKTRNYTEPCYSKVNESESLYCLFPDLGTTFELEPEMSLNYGFVMDDVKPLLRASEVDPLLEPLRVHHHPSLDVLPQNFRYTEGEPIEFFLRSALLNLLLNKPLVFQGSHLDVLPLFPGSAVSVGGIECNITLLLTDQIMCYLPQTPTQLNDGSAQVILTVVNHQMSPGSIFVHPVGLPLYMLIIIIVAVVLPILVIIVILAVCLRRQNKKEKLKQRDAGPPGIEDPAAVPLNVIHTGDRVRAPPQPPRVPEAAEKKEGVNETTPLTHGEGEEGPNEANGTDIEDEGFENGFDKDDKENEILQQITDPRLRRTIQETLIPGHLITLGEVLGKGHFGCVYAGTYSSPSDPREKKKVAVKTLQGRHFEEGMIESFLKEGVMMKNFDHPHVLELVGVSLGEQPLVILPYMAQGDLRTFIKNKQKNFTARQLLHLAQQVAQGMAYLASRYFVHRDLAARNCMIDEDEQVKVADFGLSRDLYEKDYYSSKDRKWKLPIKWMALESLEDYSFTTKSDVWSFGVLMWELLTRGVTPYPDVDAFEMRNYLASGRRLRQPKFCPDNAYILMAECWRTRPEDRPTFADLVNRLELIVNPPRRLNSTSSDEPLYMNIQRQPSLPNELEEER